ncbi:MAG: hypothetical protein IJH91_01850 [Mogibacterium sp.]|nr:hypothetical protein [Mogibacterium sp.]
MCAGLLSGCTRKYDESDVRAYIEETLGIEEYRIVEGPVVHEDSDGYEDQWWTVETYYNDLGSRITFHVINDYHYSMEWVTNGLTDDLDTSLFEWVTEHYRFTGALQPAMNEEADVPMLGYFAYEITGRGDFDASADEAAALAAFLDRYPTLANQYYTIRYSVRIETVADERLANKYYWLSFTPGESSEDLRGALNYVGPRHYDHGPVYRYLSDCLENGILNRTADFSDEEILRIAEETDLKEVVTVDGQVVCRGTVYYNNKTSISYGSLYQLLRATGFVVQGDWQHFSFVGVDGVAYEIGYDAPIEGANPYVPVETASAMLGFEVDNGFPDVEAVIPEEVFRAYGVEPEAFKHTIMTLGDEYYREIYTEDGDIVIKGKQREFNKLILYYQDKTKALSEELCKTDPYFWAVPLYSRRSYSGIMFRFSEDSVIDPRKAEYRDRLNEIVFLTMVCQILDNDITNDDIIFTVEYAVYRDGETETVATEELKLGNAPGYRY